jgi:molybdopterin-guanine dinucleotide biosynthesis protein A
MVRGEDRRSEPLAALYHRSVLPLVEKQLSLGDVAMVRVPELAGAHFVARSEVLARFGEKLFTNVNRPEDLALDL